MPDSLRFHIFIVGFGKLFSAHRSASSTKGPLFFSYLLGWLRAMQFGSRIAFALSMKKIYFAPTPAWIRVAQGIVIVALLVSGAVTPRLIQAQTTISGDIAGAVSDQSGAAVPGATVTITDSETGAAQVVTTDSRGEFRANLLKPGNYSVSVSAPSFQTTETKAFVAVGQTSAVNVSLAVAKGSETVEVTGQQVSLLQPENSDISTTITMAQVQNLPNPGGDITYYINLTQGVVMNTQGGYGNSSAFGLPATSNNFTVNGAQDNDPFLNLNNSGPSNLLLGSNDIDQVNIVANAYSAQYGGLGGVQENILTRSGSNQFHGNVNYFWTNSDMNANNWFNDFTQTKQPYSNANQWGASVGGPIIKDKAFFFANYEGLRFVTSPVSFVSVPNASYESAVLANLNTLTLPDGTPNPGYNPAEIPFYQHTFNLYNAAPGAATAQSLNSYSNFFFGTPKNNLAENLVTGRLDYKLGTNDNAFAHFKWDHGVQPTHVDPINPIFNAQSDQPDYEGQLEETHSFSPNLVNQFLFSTAWYSAYFLSVNQAQSTATFPYQLQFIDGSFTNMGGANVDWPEGRDVTQYQFNDDVSWNRGKHNISFGFIFKRDDVTDKDVGILTTPLGAEFGPSASGPLGGSDFFGNGLLLEGIQNFPVRASAPIALYNLGFYGQDQWKALPNLQLTAGLRLERNSNPICTVNCLASFNNSYSNVTANLDTPYNSVINSGLRKTFPSYQGIAVNPRVGFTFSPPDRSTTVIRAGFGMFTDIFPATIADSMLDNAPFNPQFAVIGYLADPAQPAGFANALSGVNQSFQAAFPTGGSFNSIFATNPNFSPLNFFNPNKKIYYPTYEEWSLQWQQQVGKATSFSIGYVGNHGYHEPVQNNGVNCCAVPFGGAPSSPALPAFGEITEIQNAAGSNYNGLIATVKEQSKYVTLLFNYSYSHALDEISNGGILPFNLSNTTAPINPFNLAQNYGGADYDNRNNFNGNYIITLPYFGGPRLLTDGWQFTGTIFWHSGFPFSVTDGTVTGNLEPYYGGTMLADVSDLSVPHHCSGGKSSVVNGCFGANSTTGAPSPFFSDPTGFGGQTRNSFYGPHYFNTDFAVVKNFKIPLSESTNFQIGMQGYNILNHPNFANPVNNFSDPSFGYIQSTVSVPTSVFGSFLGGDASPRILQLKAKFTF
jgi:hypothetical protein